MFLNKDYNRNSQQIGGARDAVDRRCAGAILSTSPIGIVATKLSVRSGAAIAAVSVAAGKSNAFAVRLFGAKAI